VREIVNLDKIDNPEQQWFLSSMSRLTIEIEPEQHRQIKTLATFAGMSIKEFILSKTLPGSPANAARLREAIQTPASEHRVFESLKDLEDALGI
jgi:uncharacterized protein (DUF1778 family)